MLAIHVSGKLTKADYEHFEPEFERLFHHQGNLRVPYDMTDFHGWDAGACGRTKFNIKHVAEIERLAMVGEKSGKNAWRHYASRSRKRRSDTSITRKPPRPGSGRPRLSQALAVTGVTKDNAMSTLPDQVDAEGELQRVAVRSSVDDDSSLDKAYVVMNVLSTVVASYGLLADMCLPR